MLSEAARSVDLSAVYAQTRGLGSSIAAMQSAALRDLPSLEISEKIRADTARSHG